jgi:hypothetical protein
MPLRNLQKILAAAIAIGAAVDANWLLRVAHWTP